MFGAALTGFYGFAYFGLLDTRMPYLVVIAIVLSLVPHDIMYGPQAALIAESFPGRLRYSGASLGYQLSSLIAGGPAPLIATALLSRYRSATPLALFILACAVISLIATAMLKDHTNKDISNTSQRQLQMVLPPQRSTSTANPAGYIGRTFLSHRSVFIYVVPC